jgi:hypothetical protein
MIHRQFHSSITDSILHPRETIDFLGKVIYGRNDFSPTVYKILQEMGDEPIKELRIVRTPLSTALKLALYFLTAGKIKENAKKLGQEKHDTLFHLCLFITTDKGVYSLEKNEVITMTKNAKLQELSQTMNVPIMYPLTTYTLLNNTKERMGDNFFIYDTKNTNCQNFVANILKANKLDTPENIKYIVQDTTTIFNNLSKFHKFSRYLTDLAARLDVIRQGGDINPSKNNGLTDIDLIRLLENDKKFIGKIYMKDELPSTLEKNKWYIINLQNSTDGNGTHWVCFRTPASNEPMIYFDPLIGGDPPLEILEHAKKSGVKFVMMEIQDIDATSCGWFCVACILSDKGSGTPLDHFKRFISRFSKDTERNELILHQLLLQLV